MLPQETILREVASYFDQNSFVQFHRTSKRNASIQGCMERRLVEFRSDIEARNLEMRVQQRPIVLFGNNNQNAGNNVVLGLDTTLIDHRIRDNRLTNSANYPNPLVHRSYAQMMCTMNNDRRRIHAYAARNLINEIGMIQNYLYNLQHQASNFCQVLDQNIQRLVDIERNLVRHNQHLRVYEIQLDVQVLNEVQACYRQLKAITESAAVIV